MHTGGGGGEGYGPKNCQIKMQYNTEKGDTLDFPTTPSTRLKRIWPRPQGPFQLLCIYDNVIPYFVEVRPLFNNIFFFCGTFLEEKMFAYYMFARTVIVYLLLNLGCENPVKHYYNLFRKNVFLFFVFIYFIPLFTIQWKPLNVITDNVINWFM
jgi:hypothetical protein